MKKNYFVLGLAFGFSLMTFSSASAYIITFDSDTKTELDSDYDDHHRRASSDDAANAHHLPYHPST